MDPYRVADINYGGIEVVEFVMCWNPVPVAIIPINGGVL
jgi:hypothetical protein